MNRISKKIIVVAALIVASYLPARAQSESGTPWSLQKAIDYALANNLQVKLDRKSVV